MIDWIDVNDETPPTDIGLWSQKVMALGNNGGQYNVSYFGGGVWQRTQKMIDEECDYITHWRHLTDDEK